MAKSTGKSKKESIAVVPSEEKDVATQGSQLKEVETLSRFTDFDIHLFRQGKHFKLYEKFGSHVMEFQGVVGTYFAVWAPNAASIAVTGNFNGWSRDNHMLVPRWDSSGIWEGWIPNIGVGEVYKYFIISNNGQHLENRIRLRSGARLLPVLLPSSGIPGMNGEMRTG